MSSITNNKRNIHHKGQHMIVECSLLFSSQFSNQPTTNQTNQPVQFPNSFKQQPGNPDVVPARVNTRNAWRSTRRPEGFKNSTLMGICGAMTTCITWKCTPLKKLIYFGCGPLPRFQWPGGLSYISEGIPINLHLALLLGRGHTQNIP